jgi:ATP-dependent protease Clp ATPase subunit
MMMNSSGISPKCSFCSRDTTQVFFIFSANGATICNECNDYVRDVIGSERIKSISKAQDVSNIIEANKGH